MGISREYFGNILFIILGGTSQHTINLFFVGPNHRGSYTSHSQSGRCQTLGTNGVSCWVKGEGEGRRRSGKTCELYKCEEPLLVTQPSGLSSYSGFRPLTQKTGTETLTDRESTTLGSKYNSVDPPSLTRSLPQKFHLYVKVQKVTLQTRLK